MQPTSPYFKKSVLALHGFTGCGSDFARLRESFPQSIWDTPDLHVSDVPKTFSDLLENLESRFEKTAPALPRILLGYSMGGRIALHLAFRLLQKKRFRPQDRLVLISASPGLKTEAERAERRKRDAELAKKILSASSAEKFYEFWQNIPLIVPQENMPEPWRSRLLESRKYADKTLWAQSLENWGTGTLPSLWENLRYLSTNTILICGENDEKFSRIAAEMHALLPNSRVLQIPGAGHAPHLENLNPEIFRDAL